MHAGYGLFHEDHHAFRRTVRRFVESEITPHVKAWEDAEEFPRSLFQRCGALGFFGLRAPVSLGGTAAGPLFEAVLHEELGRCGSGGVAAGLAGHVAIALPPILLFGNEAQQQRWVPRAIAGEIVGALAITEPEAGSDVAGIRTRCVRDGDELVIDGAKTYITNGVRADFVVVAVKSEPEAGAGGISMVVVERGTAGFSVGRKLRKLGWHASDTAELVFEGCRVPAANLLGSWNEGFSCILANFVWERLALALGAVAQGELALEKALAYARERRAFGRPVASFQVTRHKLADMALRLEAARQLTYHGLRLYEGGEDAVAVAAMAKRLATENALSICDDALQIHGGAGYMREYEVERYFRDARLGPIGGGTSEIMNEIVARQLGL
ncbi:acyl-CoA dehydrogenase family protein [Vulgatibacter sp.]|uniref:acyl-CoA dehydrogenase family protein n=1 Tax=Vulgatibacter sp. TaxID=1971226 RepID=UPI003569063D